MILCSLDDIDRLRPIGAAFAAALDWIKTHRGAPFEPGQTTLEPWGIIVKREETAMLPRERASLEVHRRYTDIHLPIRNEEMMGWAPADQLTNLRTPYDAETDIAFYGDVAHSLLRVRPGEMAVFFPGEAHAPNIGIGNHHKICIKIPAE